MTEKGYNGWTNYETWAVNLWMDNEEGTYNHWRDEARTVLKHNKNNKEEAANRLADLLKGEYEDGVEDALNEQYKASLYSDLLNSALSEVDWYEIAEKKVDEILEDEEYKAKKKVEV